ncbi:MAG: cysteine dioxygenase family protein [Actinocatenispora sp.]
MSHSTITTVTEDTTAGGDTPQATTRQDTATDPVTLALRYAADPDAWPFAPTFDPDRRWYGRLHADEHHEAWLLTWLPGQGTELHDHGGAHGAFLVVTGDLTEEVVGPRDAPRLTELNWRQGEVRGFGGHHVHRVVNTSDSPAVSLHVYRPGLTAMSQYAFDPGVGLRLLRTEREGADW